MLDKREVMKVLRENAYGTEQRDAAIFLMFYTG